MMKNLSIRYKRIAAVLLIIFLLSGIPVSTIPGSSMSYGGAEKTITLYTADWSDQTAYGDFDSAFGFDTLVTPAYATGWKIDWSSSDEKIAKVDEHGRVLALKAGTCTITATCTWGGQSVTDSIQVTVKKGYDPSGTFFFNSIGGSEAETDQDLSVQSADDDQDISGSSADGQNDEKISSESDPEIENSSSDSYPEIEESLEHEHVPGEILVVFDSDMSSKEIATTLSEHDAVLEQTTPVGDGSKAVLASAESEDELQGVMESLSEDDAVSYVQPNYIYTLDADGTGESSDAASETEDAASSGEQDSNVIKLIDDPAFSTSQYFHKMIDTEGAWELLEKNGISQTTVVGVVDSGVAADHIDLMDNLILTDGKYKRFNGNVFGVWSNTDYIGHGTHVAGIIGSVYGNGIFGAGVATGAANDYCKILPACIVTGSGRSAEITTNDAVNGINYVVRSGARVVNMSFGADVKDRLVAQTICDSYYSSGTVFVASGGNKTGDELLDEDNAGSTRVECMNFPGEMKEVISVCNVESSGQKHVSSYSGLAKDISAPGTEIYSTYPNDRFASETGTSMSAPVVSAVAALMLDANPELTPEEVRNIICATAYDEDDYYKSEEMGYGRIDARACVEAAYRAREAAGDNTVPAQEDVNVGNSENEGDNNESNSDKLGFSIKSYYSGEPEPFILRQNVTTTRSKSLSKVKSLSAAAASKKIKMTFGKASVVTAVKTTTTSQYYTRDWWTETETTKTRSTAGVKYQIRVKYGGSTKYYKIAASSKNTSAVKVSVSGDTLKVELKKFGSGKLKSGKTYSVAVRACKKISGTVKYGKWSKTIKVKVK